MCEGSGPRRRNTKGLGVLSPECGIVPAPWAGFLGAVAGPAQPTETEAPGHWTQAETRVAAPQPYQGPCQQGRQVGRQWVLELFEQNL